MKEGLISLVFTALALALLAWSVIHFAPPSQLPTMEAFLAQHKHPITLLNYLPAVAVDTWNRWCWAPHLALARYVPVYARGMEWVKSVIGRVE